MKLIPLYIFFYPQTKAFIQLECFVMNNVSLPIIQIWSKFFYFVYHQPLSGKWLRVEVQVFVATLSIEHPMPIQEQEIPSRVELIIFKTNSSELLKDICHQGNVCLGIITLSRPSTRARNLHLKFHNHSVEGRGFPYKVNVFH